MGGQQGYGAPPQQGYGAPPGQQPGGFGGPPGAMAAPGQFGMQQGGFGGGGGGMAGGGAKGQVRNPVMTLVISMVCCLYGLWQMWSMLGELKAYTNDQEFKPWMMFIPLLGMYFLWVKVPEQVGKAKQMAGSRNPPNGFILYFLIPYFALAKDLNEVWDPTAA